MTDLPEGKRSPTTKLAIFPRPAGRRLPALWVAGLLTASGALAATLPFAGHTIDGAFNGASSVFAADVDGDGDIDVVGAAADADDIAWWENTAGDGSLWTEHTIDAAFDEPGSVFATDVDGDGDVDVLATAETADQIAWWENTAGDGSTWSEHTIDGAFDGARAVFATDVDGDGDTDVLGAALVADDITWWENTAGDGSAWTEHTIGGAFDGAQSVYASDVDGDGDIDVLGAALIADDITWWENTAGDGSAWSEHTIEDVFNGASSVYATDVDGDGDQDVLGAAFNADDVTWWENIAGDGSAWSEHTIEDAFNGANSVYATDLDGDGDTDVLGAAGFADEVTWWENTAGDGSAWTEHTIEGALGFPQSVFAADVDGDGDTDVLGAVDTADDIRWWENEALHRSAALATEHAVDEAFDGVQSVFATDVDGDGDVDVVGAASQADDITWWENTAGDGSIWSEHTIDATFDGAASVFATDVDGDGDTDVLGAAQVDNAIAWWENTTGDGSAWTEHTIDSAFAGAHSVAATDVDGDGDIDVLGAALIGDDITWWENTTGEGSAWTEHTIDGTFNGAFSVFAADVDRDGDKDVLGAASEADDITWWENTAGDGSAWTEHTIDANFDEAESVFATDVDGDGDADVLGAARTADDITWWENTAGDGSSWTEHTIDATFDGALSVHATDLDGDGDTDVLGTAVLADGIAWWENTAGDGSAWTKHPIDEAFAGAISVFAADVDGDGDTDVLGAATTSDRVVWWENRGGQFALPTVDVATTRVEDGATVAVLDIDATHRGRAGDSAAELVTLEVMLTDAEAAPLSAIEADNLFVALSVYLDDGSGSFEPGDDTEVTFVTTFAVTPEGVLSVPFADDDPNAQFGVDDPEKYFLVVEFESDASEQVPDDAQFTHLTEASSTGEDAVHDLPIVLEFSANVASSATEVNDLPVAQPDEFVIVNNNDVQGNVLEDNGFGADSDEENDTLAAILVDPPTQGTLLGGLGSDGSFIYHPDPRTTGGDTFTYLVNDGLGNSNIATATLSDSSLIFGDDFESGDTSAWSTTVP